MTEPDARPEDLDAQQPTRPSEESRMTSTGRWGRIKQEWRTRLTPGERSVVIAWSSFTATFAGVRLLTHWIRDGHGPSGGGMSLGGKHFHHYNIGIGLLAGIGAIALRGRERHRHHPVTAVAYGSALALVVDEAVVLLDLRGVYWARDGRQIVDNRVVVVGAAA